MCNMTVIICTSCQTRNICLVASPWSRRLPLDSLHHPGAHASYPPNQEWKCPGTRQHPSRVSYPLWPKVSGMAQTLRGFYSNCFSNLTKLKPIPKFNKPTDDPKNYRPISLLCVPFKLLERLLLARLEPIIDPHLILSTVDTFRIVNGCLRPTPVKYLLVLLGIAPPALRREHHTSTLIKKALLNTTHLLHARIATAQNLNR